MYTNTSYLQCGLLYPWGQNMFSDLQYADRYKTGADKENVERYFIYLFKDLKLGMSKRNRPLGDWGNYQVEWAKTQFHEKHSEKA